MFGLYAHCDFSTSGRSHGLDMYPLLPSYSDRRDIFFSIIVSFLHSCLVGIQGSIIQPMLLSTQSNNIPWKTRLSLVLEIPLETLVVDFER